MPDVDKEKLIKVLNYTTSGFDGETLAAIRRANAMLQSAGKRWSDVMQPSKTAPTQQAKDPTIEEMLVACRRDVKKESGREFIKSLAEFYYERGYLTTKQQSALHKWYKNTRK